MKWIDNIVYELINTYGTNNPYELCNQLNISIIKLESENKLLQNNKSIYIKFNESKIIFISDDLNLNHELFYLRHELGHIILQSNTQNSLNKNILNTYKFEKQANYFAFKLSNIELDEIEMYKMTIEQIASCIKVPYHALKQLVN